MNQRIADIMAEKPKITKKVARALATIDYEEEKNIEKCHKDY